MRNNCEHVQTIGKRENTKHGGTSILHKKASGYYQEHYEASAANILPITYLRHGYTLEMLDGLKPGKALDIGCDQGDGERITDRGYSRSSRHLKDMLKATKKQSAKEKNVIQYTQDIESIASNQTRSTIICTSHRILENGQESNTKMTDVTTRRNSLLLVQKKQGLICLSRRTCSYQKYRTNYSRSTTPQPRTMETIKKLSTALHFYPVPIP